MIANDEDEPRTPGTGCEIIPLRPRRCASPALDRVVQGRIGEQLRAMYEALAEAPIPARITALLGALDHGREGGRG